MPYAIELYFDPATDARIRSIWASLAAAGISFMHSSHARPHVSLTVCDTLDLPATQHLLDHYGNTEAPFSISFPSFGWFASPAPVVFLAPKVIPRLLQLHSTFFQDFTSLSHSSWPHYQPPAWVAHCTLATDFPSAELPLVFDICQSTTLPITGTITEIGIVEFRPIKQLHSVPLNTPPP